MSEKLEALSLYNGNSLLERDNAHVSSAKTAEYVKVVLKDPKVRSISSPSNCLIDRLHYFDTPRDEARRGQYSGSKTSFCQLKISKLIS